MQRQEDRQWSEAGRQKVVRYRKPAEAKRRPLQKVVRAESWPMSTALSMHMLAERTEDRHFYTINLLSLAEQPDLDRVYKCVDPAIPSSLDVPAAALP